MKVRSVVLLALLALLAVKAAAMWQLGHHPLLEPSGEVDAAYYRHLGEMVAGGDVALSSKDSLFGQPPGAFFLAPFYVYFLGLIFKLSHNSIVAARAVQIVLGTGGVLLLALAIRRWFGGRAAWGAGILAGLCGLFTFYEVLILPAALDPFFTGLDLFLLAKAADEDTPPAWAWAGLAIGVHALNRPHIAFVAAGLAVVLAVRAIRRRALAPAQWPAAAAFVAAVVIAISPVAIRNYEVSGQWVPIASNFGINMFMGNGPDAIGTPSRAGDILPTVSGEWVGANATASAALGHASTGYETSTFFLKRVASWTIHHPGAELTLLAKKTWYSLSATFFTLNHSYVFFAHDVRGPLMLLAVGPALLIPFGIAGLFFARPRNRRGYWVWASYLGFALLSTILAFVAARYRVSALMMLAGLSGAGISWMIDRWREERASELVVPALVVVAFTVVAIVPTRGDDGRSEEMVRMSLAAAQGGDVEGAESWAERAMAAHAQPAVVHVRLGQIYEANARPTEAISHYKAALATDPKEPALHFVLGRAYMGVGDLSGAVRELAGARVGDQRDAASRMLVVALARANRRDETNTVVHDLNPNQWDISTARRFALDIADAGRVDLSIPAWTRAAELSNDAEDYERLGLSWAMLGRGDDAMQALAEAVSRAPSTASYRLNLGVALARSSRFTAARDQIEEALRIDPNYEPAKQALAALKR